MTRTSKFDLFGQAFSFNATKYSKTFNTVSRGLLTLIYIVLMAFITFVIAKSFLNTSNPVVSVNKVRLSSPLPLDFHKHRTGIFYIVYAKDKYLTTQEAARYVTFRAFHSERTEKDTSSQETISKVPFKNCADFDNQYIKESIQIGLNTATTLNLTKMFSESIFCGNPGTNPVFITGSRSKLPSKMFSVRIYPCSLPDPTQCANLEELATLSIGSLVLTNFANYSDKGSPLLPAIDSDVTLPFNVANKLRLTKYFKENFIYDEDMDFVEEKQTFSYIDVDRVHVTVGTRLTQSVYCSVAQIDAGACEPYFETESKSSAEKMVIQRKYRTFYYSVSEAGGFVDLFYYGFLGLYFFYNQWEYSRWLTGQLIKNFVGLKYFRGGRERGGGTARVEMRQEISRISGLATRQIRWSQKEKNLTVQMLFSPKIPIEMLMYLNNKAKLLLKILGAPYLNPLVNQYLISRKLRKFTYQNQNIGRLFVSRQIYKKERETAKKVSAGNMAVENNRVITQQQREGQNQETHKRIRF